MHFPLIDPTINKLKPAFFQQAMGLDVLATFVPMRSQLAGFTSAAEHWFSYKLHEKSNYSTEVMSWIDHMLVSGHGIIKTIWNPDKKQVEFQAMDKGNFGGRPHYASHSHELGELQASGDL